MKHNVRYRVEYFGFRIFIFFIKISPLFLRKFFRSFALGIFSIFGKRYQTLVKSNLKIAFPDLSDKDRLSLKKKILKHFSSIFVDIIYLFGGKNPDKVVGELKVEGIENIRNVLKKGKGAILFSAHFGNWELIPFILFRELGFRVSSIARRMDNPLTEQIVKKFRAFMGSDMIYKEGSLRKIIRVTEENGLIYLLIDQNTITREGVPVTFFGREVIAVTTVSQLYLKKGIPIIPLFLTYQKDSIVLKIGEEISFKQSSDHNKDLRELTQKCMSLIENIIREFPDHWFWFHDRWRPREGQKKRQEDERK
ncbi:MAG: lysophospholipid acyltransferase family protein [Acidobacteriota bacterium]